ncbi:MAG: hypothetical protein ACKOFZ_05785 [Ilumatobacteraceae bacterium]|jgi:hypothetical protein
MNAIVDTPWIRSMPRRRRASRLLGLVVLACSVSSCGIPDDEGPREIDPALLENITDQS